MLRQLSSLIILLLVFLGYCSLASPYSVTATPSKSEYAPGETVSISVRITPAATVVLLWEVKDPSGSRRDFGQLTCQGGSCSFSFVTGSNWPTGTYSVIIAVSGTNDKGYTSFVLRTPAPPPPPPPPTIDYESLARSRIAAVNSSLRELYAALESLSSILSQVGVEIDPNYRKQLDSINETLSRAVSYYNAKDYETAYSTANNAFQMVSGFVESFSGDLLRALAIIARDLQAKSTDAVTADLLKSLEKELGRASPRDSDILSKLSTWSRILVVVARTLKVPELEASLNELTLKLERLGAAIRALNQTNAELQARITVLEQEKQSLSDKLSSVQKRLDEATAEIDRLTRANADLSSENAELKKQLSESLPRSTANAAAIVAAVSGLGVGIAISRLVGRRKPSAGG
ncbi:MAG: hypothetical protein QXT33_06465 [Thermofilum sp.]